jgi:hypothetical protein
MPIYEYVCEEPGKKAVVIELLRSVADADKPVPDPENKGRVFKRKLSMFATGGAAAPGAAPSSGHVHSGSCGCGKRRGSCGM